MTSDPQAEADIRKLVEIINLLTICEVCNGSGKFSPECGACLTGQPERCTCSEIANEACPHCNGTTRHWSDLKAFTIFEGMPYWHLVYGTKQI